MHGLTHLDNLINENLTDLVQLFKAQEGKAFDPRVLVKKFLFNIILSMVSVMAANVLPIMQTTPAVAELIM